MPNPEYRLRSGLIKVHYKGPELHGSKGYASTKRTDVFEEVTCKRCLAIIEKRRLKERPDLGELSLESSNVKAYVESVNSTGTLKRRLDAASNAMLERNAARRKLELKEESVSPMEEFKKAFLPEDNYMESVKETLDFSNSPRGRYIMAQALYLGIQKLCEVEGVNREVSNICNMQYLLDVLYPGMEQVFKVVEQERRS